jgi:cell wall-associated NlpC family hydrolase
MGQRLKKTITALACIVALLTATPVIDIIAKPNSAVSQTLDLKQSLWHQRASNNLQQAVTKATLRANKTPYVFSGSTTRGWDCSGLVRWVYSHAGITLPHSADKQGHIGQRVSIAKRGDIVVFAYQGRKDFYHAAIYLGQGLILNANREYGTTVIEPLKNFEHSQIRFIRVL